MGFGRLQACSSWSWRWKRRSCVVVLLCVLGFGFGSVLVLFGMKDGGASSKGVEQFLEERLNISKDQLVYRASSSLRSDPDQKTQSPCINEAGCQMPLTDGLTCAAQELSSDVEKSELLRKWSAVKFEGMDQCPVQVIHEKSEVTTAREELVPNVSSQSTRITSSEVQILGTICWCVIFGIVVYWCVRVCSVLYGKVLDIMKRTRTDLKNRNNQKKKYLPTPSKGRREWRGRLLILFLMSGVIGATWLFWFVKESAILWRTEMLASMCDERARMLQDQFNVSMNHVHALAILVSTFHHGKHPSAIDQKTFAEYTERTAFERPLTSGVAYALKVVHSERKNFEKTYGWTIKKMKEEGHSAVHDYDLEKLDPSPDQDEYAPVIFSQESVSHIVSIDMMSVKEDRENILRTRASGKGALTPPFKLLKSNHIGVVLTFAVYDTTLPTDATPEQHTEATVGYLGASYDVPSLVETLLHQLASKQPIVVNVYDITNISSPIKMYGPRVRNTGPLHISNLDFGDPYRRHEMRCRFKHKPPPPWTAMLTSTGFLVITLLVGYIFRAAINRIAKVEGEYHEMMKLKVQAEAADLAKSQFLATVSHEIRTPMNGVIGMLQMLMNTDLNADQLDYALTAHSSGKDLITLINEVLDQAKVESGRLELETVQFDPRSVLDNVLSVFFDKVHDKGIELAVYVSESVPDLVVGDPGRFGQIVANLVGNSVKFTEGGHIFVSVHLTDEARTPLELKDEVLKQQLELARNGINRSYDTLSGLPVVDRWKSWQNFQKLSGFITEASEMIGLLVTVEDTGVGIMQDAQRRMFTPFMQANSSTSRTYGGTGIGLNISKCLVDIMGGEIGFVSEPGIGSTFSFALALRKCETNMLITKAHQLPSRSSEFRGMRALVIGGNNIRAQVTKYHLCRLGIYVDIATSLEFMRLHLSNIRHVSGKHLDMILFETDGFDEETTLALHCVLKDLSQGVKNNGFLNRSEMFLLATSSSIKHGQFKSTGYVDAVIMKPLTLNVLVTHFQEVFGAGYKKQQSNVKSSLQSVLSEKHILVVDDNAVNRRVAEGLLTRYGAKVTCVENGKTAVEFLRPPHKFDACFMDLQMPQMDGFEATRQIRCIENELNNMIQLGEASNETFGNSVLWHTPILAMTADVIQVTCDKRIKCGMDGYVLKPFEEEQLHSTLTHLFQSTH